MTTEADDKEWPRRKTESYYKKVKEPSRGLVYKSTLAIRTCFASSSLVPSDSGVVFGVHGKCLRFLYGGRRRIVDGGASELADRAVCFFTSREPLCDAGNGSGWRLQERMHCGSRRR